MCCVPVSFSVELLDPALKSRFQEQQKGRETFGLEPRRSRPAPARLLGRAGLSARSPAEGGAGWGGAREGRGQRRSHSLARAAGAPSCSLPGLCSRLTAGVALTSWLPCAHSPRESGGAVFSRSLHHTPPGSSRLLSLSLPFSCFPHLALSPRFPLSLPAFCSPSDFLYPFSTFLSTATSYQ